MRPFSRSIPGAISLLFCLILAACGSLAAPPAAQPSRTASSLPSPSAAPSMTPSPSPSASPAPTLTATHPAPQARKTLLLAHYMPWYQSKETSGAWGWHWTMNHFDPDSGTIASHFSPLTGPYDSSDPALLEYQVLLMKLAGIDGVIVDWYGTANAWDYPAINRNTQLLFAAIQKAGLKFVICYEDQTIKNLLANQLLKEGADIPQGQADMRFLQQNWFQDPAYLKQDGRPVLLVFGPQYYKSTDAWQAVFEGLDPAPLLVTENTPLAIVAPSSFPWPPMSAARDGVLAPAALESYLNQFYADATGQPWRIGGAFPGFQDIYQEAGVSAGYGLLDARGGETWRGTLESAVADSPDVIQLITWNDYGEGTNIEPAEPYGYLYMEMLQAFRRQEIEPGFAAQAADLRLPLEIYRLRKLHPNDTALNARLDQAFTALVSGDTQAAMEIVAGYK
jgi:hypothetical protein